MSRFDAFRKKTDGNVATIFALSLFPIMGITGLGVDYANVRHEIAQYQSALDSTVLMLAHYAPANDAAALAKIGQPYFESLAKQKGLAVSGPISASKTETQVTLNVAGTRETYFGQFFGLDQWTINVRAEASYGTRQIEVAMVLDNTGSMAAYNKIGELKKASHSLVSILQGVAVKPGQVKIAMVPYTTRVNIGTTYRLEPWLTNKPVGTGFLPSENYHVPANKKDWGGCVAERDAPYNTTAQPATTATPGTLYTMVNCEGALAEAMPLTTDFGALHTRIDTMKADGWTNITLGAQFGMEMLSPSAPFTQTGSEKNIDRFMILLTDGMNTKDRWTNVKKGESAGSAAIEARMNKDTQAMCDSIKAQGIRLYTVLVLEGNETVLKNCASSPDMYKKVEQANQLESVFKAIANDIGKISLTM